MIYKNKNAIFSAGTGGRKMAKIISILNQKGGVGKTTTAVNFGYELAEKNKKVLLVDLDPQANLTVYMGNYQTDYLKQITELFVHEINEEEYRIEDYILTKGKLDYIPAGIELSGLEMTLINQMSREYVLKRILSNVKAEYDYIIIDCMPSLGLLIINALAASDSVLITATGQFLSAKGLELLMNSIARVRKNLNEVLAIDGILITMYQDHLKNNKEILELIKVGMGEYVKVFETKIPKSVKADESSYEAKAVREKDRNNKVGLAYQSFTEEYLKCAK